MKKLLLITFCFLLMTTANSQLIKPMGKGLKYPAVDIFVDEEQKSRLVLQLMSVNKDSLLCRYLISRWENQSWEDVTTVTLKSSDWNYNSNCVHDIVEYKGDIYLGGTFEGVGFVPAAGTKSIIRWNGSSWVGVSGFLGNYIRNMEVAAGKLFVSGQFNSLRSFDGSSWTSLNGLNGQVYVLASHNDLIYAGGMFQVPSAGMSIWNEDDQQFYGVYQNMTNATGGDFVFDTDTSFIFAQSTTLGTRVLRITPSESIILAEKLPQYKGSYYNPTGPSVLHYHHMAYTRGRLWLSIGINDSTSSIYYMDKDVWTLVKSEELGCYHGAPRLKAVNDSIIVIGAFRRNQTTLLDYVGVITDAPPGMLIKGKVFADKDLNCSFSANDIGIKKVKLRIDPGNHVVETNKHGNYELFLPKGVYTVKLLEIPKGSYLDCSTDTLMADSFEAARNFPLKLRSGFHDHEVSLVSKEGFGAVKGREQTLQLKVENKSLQSDTVGIVLEYDTTVSEWISSDIMAVGHVGNKASFIVKDVPPLGESVIKVKLKTFSSSVSGDTLKHVLYLDSLSALKDSIHNDKDRDTLTQRVTAPLDPNDKRAWPEKDLNPGSRLITYHIRFQNVGTADAIRVRVVDTIDTNIPIENIRINSASHEYSLYIEKNVLTWVFDPIHLPDSGTNEEASHGFINYTVTLKPGMPIGTKIRNTAYIYFDWEAPVITNTVVHTMFDWPESVKPVKSQIETLKLYPNPASDQVIIENTAQASAQLKLADVLGRVVWEGQVEASGKIAVNVSAYSPGLYFLTSPCGSSRLVIEK